MQVMGENTSEASVVDPKGVVRSLLGERLLLAQLFSEGLGTLLIAFSLGCALLMAGTPWSGVAYASVVMVMSYALATASFVHFNPAITVAAMLTKQLPLFHGAMYILVQLACACGAGLTLMVMFQKYIRVQPAEGFEWWQAGLAEGFLSCVLSFVHLNVVHSKKHAGKNEFYGLALGATIMGTQVACSHISGGIINPAIACGWDFPVRATGENGLGLALPFYAGCQIAGGVVAALLFASVRPKEVLQDSQKSLCSIHPKLLAEFFGTLMFALTFGLCIDSGKNTIWGVASMLVGLSFALNSVSGAHLNPAVTLAIIFSCRDKMGFGESAAYIVMQIGGAVLGACGWRLLSLKAAFPLEPEENEYSLGQTLACEFAFTFILAFVVSSTTAVRKDRRLSEYFGLAHGMCMALGGLALGKVSGGWLNPAMVIGVTSVRMFKESESLLCLMYIGAHVAAGIHAAGALFCTKPSEFVELQKRPQIDEESSPSGSNGRRLGHAYVPDGNDDDDSTVDSPTRLNKSPATRTSVNSMYTNWASTPTAARQSKTFGAQELMNLDYEANPEHISLDFEEAGAQQLGTRHGHVHGRGEHSRRHQGTSSPPPQQWGRSGASAARDRAGERSDGESDPDYSDGGFGGGSRNGRGRSRGRCAGGDDYDDNDSDCESRARTRSPPARSMPTPTKRRA